MFRLCLMLSSFIWISHQSLAGDFKLENGSFTYHQASHDLQADMTRIARGNRGPTYFAFKIDSLTNYKVSGKVSCNFNLVAQKFVGGGFGGYHFSSEAAPSKKPVMMLFKFEKGDVTRFSVIHEYCSVNGGGEVINWFNHVNLEASIQFMADLMITSKQTEEAAAAIAMHDHPQALETFINYSDPTFPNNVRKTSIFWMAQLGGSKTLDRLEELVHQEQQVDLRTHLTFVLSQMDDDRAQALLKGMALGNESEDVRLKALFWMAQSGHPDAEEIILDEISKDPSHQFIQESGFLLSQLPDGRGIGHLEKMVQNHSNPEMRKNALFWLGQTQKDEALDMVMQIIDEDSDVDVRKHAVFVLGQFTQDLAIESLIKLAEGHGDREVRGTALFWLGQKASHLSKNTLKDRVMHDDDLEVMKQALLGISHMPADEKIPLLIEVAQDHEQGEIRKQAIFWLSQTGDQRALKYLKDILLENP